MNNYAQNWIRLGSLGLDSAEEVPGPLPRLRVRGRRGPRVVAVPAEWNLPSGELVDGFLVTFDGSLETDSSVPAHRAIIAGILTEAIKRHFKDNHSDSFGPLWQGLETGTQGTGNGDAGSY